MAGALLLVAGLWRWLDLILSQSTLTNPFWLISLVPLGFICSGGALWILHDEDVSVLARRLANVGTSVTLFIGSGALVYYAWKYFGHHTPSAIPLDSNSAAVPLSAAINFVLAGAALLWLDRRREMGTSQLLALALIGLSLTTSVEHVYEFLTPDPLDTQSGSSHRIGETFTSLLFLVLGLGLLCARWKHGLLADVVGGGSGSTLARRMVPSAIAIPLVLGWLQLVGQRAQLFESEFAIAFCATASLLVFVALIAWNAATLNRTEVVHEQAEALLRRSEERLRAFMDNTPALVFIKDEDGRYVYLNKAIENFVHKPATQLLGATAFDRLPLEFAQQLHENSVRVLETGQAQEFEEVVPTPDGRLHHEIVMKFPLHDVDGRRLVAGVAMDITERKHTEAELRQSRERLQIALDNGRIGLWDWDVTNNRVEFSTHWKNQLGYEDHEIGHDYNEWKSRLHPDDVEGALERVQKYFDSDNDNEYSNEFRIQHKSGSYLWMLARGTIYRNDDGRVYRILGSHVDITDLKTTQSQLIESRQELQRAHDELEIRVQDRTEELAKANRTLRSQIVERQMAMGALHEVVARLEQSKEQTESANEELRRNEAHLLESNRIFTRLARLRVSEAHELQSTIQEITRVCCEMLDIERCSVWHFNSQRTAIDCLDLYERTPQRHSHGDAWQAEDYPDYFSSLESTHSIVADDALTHPAMLPVSHIYLEPLGISSVLDTAILVGGEMVGVLCCEHVGEARPWKVSDQTFAGSAAAICSLALESHERARAEAALWHAMENAQSARQSAEEAQHEAERANQSKSEFLSRMSHELRTPLNAVLGFGQVLEMENLTASQLQSVEHILKGGRHLLELINEVLDIARLEAGRINLSVEPIAVWEVVRESLDLVRPLASQYDVSIDDNTDLPQHTHILADRQRLKQVLINLLANAVKYNRRAGSVAVSCHQMQGKRLRLEVRDTGPGIANDDLTKLFVPFERLNAGFTEVEGTGLGLALSKHLMEAMNGTIHAQSIPGEGSTFAVELPMAESPLDQIAHASEIELQPPQSTLITRHYTILSIEDNTSNYRLIQAIFSNRPNIRLVGAVNGAEGFDMALEHLPDLILLDVHLPDISGDEVLRRLRELPETQNIPVIVLSADATATQIERLMEAGATAYLTKPINVKEFLRTLDQTLESLTPNQNGDISV